MAKSFTVYVAASSRELERAEGAIQALKDLGHTVVHDWPALVRAVGSANPRHASDDKRMMWASEDLNGVSDADVFWLLMPNVEGGFGAGVELGYAIAGQGAIVCSGPVKRSIFTVYADRVYDTDLDALKAEFGHGVL